MIELLNVLKFVLIIFISLSYFKSQNYMKVMRKNLIGIANLHISTIVLLNAGTVPTVWYIFFSFYYRLWTKNSWVAIAKIWLWSSSVIKIVNMKYNRIDIKWRLVSTSFKIYLEILSNFYFTFTICYYNSVRQDVSLQKVNLHTKPTFSKYYCEDMYAIEGSDPWAVLSFW